LPFGSITKPDTPIAFPRRLVERYRRVQVRLACGNGLRPDIWEGFQKRFSIPQILEWYAATEGNAVLINFDGKPGAVGRIPFYLKRKFSIEVIRRDTERDFFLGAQDAVKYGLVDKVLVSRENT
jgi:hypothetical protein